ncbi:non-ribosomal peptide synthetase [Pseudomonas sp. RIT-PI-S]|uniref:non-ribosomal peptide synthetase n=1 Tax=Pseudomonas sp. RIT-PI-S TaxID=3035295 RepID=UPI0021D95265|nr:non-ribosomal peptide synthetase [Pseudomonas sp. RIT-PI-S]
MIGSYAAFPGQPSTLLARFAEQVRRAPQALAVVDPARNLSYAELAEASECIARGVQAQGVTRGQAVALCMPRGWQWVATLLGALKAGATVVPLDRASPLRRREQMLIDAGCVGLLGLEESPGWALPAPLWYAGIDALLDHPAQPPQPMPEGFAEVMFLFYTSGSTGTPKAVEVGERGLLRLAEPRGYIDIRPGDRFACLSNPAFDACSFELWAPLLNGGCCVMLAEQDVLEGRRLAKVLEEQGVDSLFMTVALFNTLSAEWPGCFASLRQVLIGGEQLSAAAVRAWYAANPHSDCRLFNVYGPTECTTFALCYPIPRDFAAAVVPIGRPLPDTGAQVLDERQRPVATGEVGELYLSGSGVARGYRQRPEASARAFVRLPALDGGAQVHYRSGDRVRQGANGLIEYVGRVDRQVKIRGFRVEPGEVEQTLLTHPGVAQAYVCTQRQAAEDHQLLAFIVPRPGLEYLAFSAYLREQLAPYMRPQRLFLVERLPLTANGKVDRQALLAGPLAPWHGPLAPWHGPAEQAADDDPASPLQWLLAQARTLLAQPAVGAQDDWLGSGGSSLNAMRLRSAIRDRWNCEVSAAAVLAEPFAALAARLVDGQGAAVYPVPSCSTAQRAPASAEQQRLWLIQQRTPESTAYNVPLTLHLPQDADLAAVEQALTQLVARHPALRTAFVQGPEGLDQVIAEHGAACQVFAAGQFTEASWPAFAELLFATPFELAVPSLFQAYLLPLAEGSSRLLLHLHHIIVDGWSLNLLFDDLDRLYREAVQGRGDDEPAPRLTTVDFANWQRQWRGSAAYQGQRQALALWHQRQPAPSPALLPLQGGGAQAGLYRQALGAERAGGLERFCTQQRLTRFEVLLGVFTWGVYALTGCERPRIASPVSNRPLAAFERTVGMLANTVLIPTDLDPALSLDAQLRQQVAAARQVLALQDVALEDLVQDLRLSSSAPLFDFMFVLENTDYAALARSALGATVELAPATQAKCALTLTVVGEGAEVESWWEFHRGYFNEAQVQALDELLRSGLDRLLAQPTLPLGDWLAPYRRALPPASEGARDEAPFAILADWFEHQARSTPAAAAMMDRQRQVSYAELDALADGLAARLLREQPWPDQNGPVQVVLLLEASLEHVVALLALAKLNITAVPLDPAYPLAVQRQVLALAQPHCLLFARATEAALERLGAGHCNCLEVVLGHTAVAEPWQRPRHGGERPLYTLFTSGSTGTPKGVQVMDLTLCNLLQWQRREGGLAARASTLQFSMLAFDVSFQEVFSTLCGGGCYHLITPGWRQDAEALLGYLVEARIERLFLPCVALQHLAQTAVARGVYPAELREVITAGEQLLCSEALRRWFEGMPQASLFNHYGPTETHVVSAYRLPPAPASWPLRAPIGQAVSNARLLLVDAHDRPVPAGSQGRLLVAGPMVQRCYLGDPALNAARFVERATAGGGRQLYYRTGDLAWADGHGCLHYLGRDDQQIKLSGHRLELGQVETALLQLPQVVNAVVTFEAEPPRLTAYVQLDGTAVPVQALDRQVAQHLPAQVRIDQYRRIEQWPRTPSGKIDRKALAGAGEALSRQREPQAMGLSPLEQQLSELFREVIGHDIGPDETFFDAGATSLGLMRLHARYNQALATPVSMADLFEQVSIRRLAAHLSAAPAATAPRAGVPAGLDHQPMAIIGMAVNVAGASDLGAFWRLVSGGELGIERFSAADGLVGARSQLDGLLAFDPDYFGISRQEARLMDPQQRHLLMACVQALEHAAIVPGDGQRIGLIASCGETTYFQQLLRASAEGDLPDGFQLALHHDKDFLATKAAYHLGLTGPAMSAQAACGSSLIATHLASALLRQGDSDVMLAAGVLIDPTLTEGYRYRSQHIFSKDGLCRPFSEDASGTIGASGYGVVVLKPLARAQADGDRIYALLEGSALNNDGHDKLSYTAPSVAGQRGVIADALNRAGVRGADIGYVEAHGTGTLLGDPVEVAALSAAFGDAPAGACALASVKSQIGHLGAAAGVVGLIRAALAVFHGVIPPNLGFSRANPQIDLERSPFYVPTQARPWPAGQRRLAGVSSFGIGGTNAHVVIGQAPLAPAHAEVEDDTQLLMVSAHSRSALLRDLEAVDAYLQAFPEHHGALLRYLQSGRPQQRWRFAMLLPPGERLPTAPVVHEVAQSIINSAPRLDATGQAPAELLSAWYQGANLGWPGRAAPPPWDFPPSAFDLDSYRFQAIATPPSAAAVASDDEAIERKPLAEWFYQRQWLRTRRLNALAPLVRRELLVVCTHEVIEPALLVQLQGAYQRVVQVRAGSGWRELDADRYELDPLDAQALARLLDVLHTPALGELDWLHALPLAVTGAVDERSLAAAQWACLDTPCALLQGWGQRARTAALRLWLVSWQACPVDGHVARPELAALAGVNEVAPQEYPVRCHWLDWPSPRLADHAAELTALLAEPSVAPRRMAVRGGYLWQPRLLPSPLPAVPPSTDALPAGGTFLVLGGSGGIGRSLGEYLLRAPQRRVVLLSRQGEVPAALAHHGVRVQAVAADLGDLARWPRVLDDLAERHGPFAGVIHAAGMGAGSLIRLRDPRQLGEAMAAKTRGLLAVEALIARMTPGFVLYCSSMSAMFGGAGHLDYAASNAMLDGFTFYAGGASNGCQRLCIDWDIWREVGMAVGASSGDAAHQQHLTVGLTVDEGCQVFERAMAVRLPQLLVSTTALDSARRFYPRRQGVAMAPAQAEPAAPQAIEPSLRQRLHGCLCKWLGVEALADDDNLYDLGADSLTLLDLIDELQAATGEVFQLSQFSHQVSLGEVLALVRASSERARPSARDGWANAVLLDPWHAGAGRQWLYLIHPVGGDVQAYRELVAALHPDIGVCVIADPALRLPDLPPISLDERAAAYLQAIQARHPQGAEWQVAGWSFGAWVAQALCALAPAAGLAPPRLYLIDPPAPDAGKALAAIDEQAITQVFQREFAQRWPGAIDGALPADLQAYLQRLTHCCRNNIASMAAFEPPSLAATPTQLFIARQANPYGFGTSWQLDELKRAWQGKLGCLESWQPMDTDHYGIVSGRWARDIAAAISAATQGREGARHAS